MFYTIYKTIDKLNDKIYIGKHQTKDLNDEYLGSGKILNIAIKEYGIENFCKEILFVFKTEAEMNAKEAELVTEEFCLREDTYNLCPGGKGGWGYVNKSGIAKMHDKKQSENAKRIAKQTQLNLVKRLRIGGDLHEKFVKTQIGKPATKGTTGFKYPDEVRSKMSRQSSGVKNSQYGTIWITNGTENKKIDKKETIPQGWYKGRKIKSVG